MTKQTWTTDGLEAFLIEAYEVAWPRNVQVIRDGGDLHGFERVHYARDSWTYNDIYFGASNDAGMELVRHESVPVWMNVYRGGLTSNVTDYDVFDFLVQALDAPTSPGSYRPRGPAAYVSDDGDLKYQYQGHGDLTRFAGTEVIMLGNRIVYERVVSGGLVGEASFPLPADLNSTLFRQFS